MIPMLLAAALGIALFAALVVVVIGIRQEPSTNELRRQPPTHLAALVRQLLGVSVRKPDPQVADDGPTAESCSTGPSAWPGR
jgi:hypothetical protein